MKSLIQHLFTRRTDEEVPVEPIPLMPFSPTAEDIALNSKIEVDGQKYLSEKRADAERSAMEFLCAHLDSKQLKELSDYNYFKITGQKTKQTYTVTVNGSVLGFCVHPAYYYTNRPTYSAAYPRPDIALLMKLMIEGDEDTFLRFAVGNNTNN